MTQESKQPNQKRHQKPKKSVPLPNPEEQAKILAARQKAEEEAKKEAERIELFGKSVEKMSHRQLSGELRRAIKREYAGRPPEPQPGLNIALGTILLTVLSNTKTKENPFGKLHAYPR